MNAVYVLGFLCLVSVSRIHGGHGGHGGYGGHWGHHGRHSNIDYKACFNSGAFMDAVRNQPGCEELGRAMTTPAPADGVNPRPPRRFQFGRMGLMMNCTNAAFNLRNADGATVVENVKAMIRQTSQPEKAEALANAYGECAGTEPTLTGRTAAWNANQCYFRKLPQICPRAVATTPATA